MSTDFMQCKHTCYFYSCGTSMHLDLEEEVSDTTATVTGTTMTGTTVTGTTVTGM